MDLEEKKEIVYKAEIGQVITAKEDSFLKTEAGYFSLATGAFVPEKEVAPRMSGLAGSVDYLYLQKITNEELFMKAFTDDFVKIYEDNSVGNSRAGEIFSAARRVTEYYLKIKKENNQ